NIEQTPMMLYMYPLPIISQTMTKWGINDNITFLKVFRSLIVTIFFEIPIDIPRYAMQGIGITTRYTLPLQQNRLGASFHKSLKLRCGNLSHQHVMALNLIDTYRPFHAQCSRG